MKKIVLLPLDERPCNYDFVYKLFQSEELQLSLTPQDICETSLQHEQRKLRTRPS